MSYRFRLGSHASVGGPPFEARLSARAACGGAPVEGWTSPSLVDAELSEVFRCVQAEIQGEVAADCG
jgi:hypothetical protein